MSEVKETKAPVVQPKKEAPKNVRYMRDKDREKVRGIFKFYEVPGGSMNFVFRKYKEDPVERYDLIDGQVYTLPLGVAKHLNNNCSYPIHEYTKTEQGGPVMRIGQKVHRTGFQSLEFVDVDELTQTKSVVTVEHTGI